MTGHACIIHNPAAGRGRAAGLAHRMIAAARRLGWDVTVRSSRHAGEERDLAAVAREEGWPVVVAAGGDGTVHNVANGLLGAGPTQVILGHLPIGNGNDFAKILGLTRMPLERQVARVLGGRARRLDTGQCHGEYFLNGMGIGFDAEVVRQLHRLRGLRGFALYLAAVCRTVLSFKPLEMEITADGRREAGRFMLLEIAIGTTAGGGFRLTPTAVPDDGLFDLCAIRAVGVLRFLRYVPRVVRGTHGSLAVVTLTRARRVRITADIAPVPTHLDGELRLWRESTIELEILPRHLAVLCAA